MAGDDPTFRLPEVPVHLGLGGRAVPQEPFDGTLGWYERYSERNEADGAEGRLVSLATFAEPWAMWEVHPEGDELVVCLSGVVTLHQEVDGEVRTVELRVGDGVVNPSGTWHTADVDAPATMLFVTAGAGTQHRPR